MLTFDKENQKNIWVENPYGGNAFLEFEVRTTEDQTVVLKDRIRFYSFTSAVIAFGGLNQVPSDPPDANHGAFVIARDLYLDGYDVHMFDEEELGSAENEVYSAIENRSISQVASFGYSWGGDATFDLTNHLPRNIQYAAYIDAINKPYNPFHISQDQRPDTDYHVNRYQRYPTGTLRLRGDAIIDPLAVDDEHDESAENINHYNVDDLNNVRNNIKYQLMQKVNK